VQQIMVGLKLSICLIFTTNQAWYSYKRYTYKRHELCHFGIPPPGGPTNLFRWIVSQTSYCEFHFLCLSE